MGIMKKWRTFFGSNNEKWECIGKTSEMFKTGGYCLLCIL